MINCRKIFAILFLLAAANYLSAAGPKIRMGHVLVRADVNEVRLDNVYMLSRGDANGPGQVKFELPRGAFNIETSGGADVLLDAEAGTITKKFDPNDSGKSSVSFSYSLKNAGGKCSTELKWPLDADSIAIYPADKKAQVAGKEFKLEIFESEGKTSRVYIAKRIKADAPVELMISNLPARHNQSVFIIAAAAGLVLIVLAGIILLIKFPKGTEL